MKLRWRYGILAGVFLAIFSLYPQLNMFYLRGSQWNGHYAYNDIDEVAYAAYIKALIDGRPRKNDPYTGRDETPDKPQPESLFSIQFAAPYTIAVPARIFGIGAPWAMTISGAAAAFLTALIIFWIIGMITGDSLFAMAGSLVVLAGGALFAGEGAIGEILFDGFSYPYFPGFRRYLPAMAMPAFFLFVGLVCKLISHETRETNEKESAGIFPHGPFPAALLLPLAAMSFAYVVFSYFYIWTTAAAWLGCVSLCLLAVRPIGVWTDLKHIFMLGMGCGIIILPYAYLLSHRSQTIDDVQMLVRTHAPDLTRVPEVIGVVILVIIAAAVISRTVKLKDRITLIAISLAMTPIIIFNQQIVTGQSLQPIHYQVFIGNYVAGLAVVATLAIFWNRAKLRGTAVGISIITLLAVIAVAWGLVECYYTVRVLDDVNVMRDEALPVAKRLAELAKDDANALSENVLHLGIAEADDLPTIAPQPVLWARHQHVFAGETRAENKERYYQQLYYQGTSARQLAEGMKHGGDFVSMIALFGWGRHSDRLNADYKPLTFGEIDEVAARYDDYARNFSAKMPSAIRLDYLIAPVEADRYLDNVDKWYERGIGEIYGKYVLYRLKPR
jgi:hypothetical protein